MMGIPSRVLSAWAWKAFTMFTQDSGVFTGGVDPPPDSTDPSCHSAMSAGLSKTAPRSAWVIWPIFSTSVMRPSRSATRLPTGRSGSW
jgi:hypothetical protein